MGKSTYIHSFRQLIVVALLCCTLLTSCGDDKEGVSEEHEEELITTVRLSFTKQGESVATTFSWKSNGRATGEAQSRDSIRLDANATYALSVQFLNDGADVSEEIRTEKDEHLLVFLPSSTLKLSYSYSDQENPLGLNGTMTTSEASTGDLRVVLRHEPKSKAAPTDLTAVGGSTDVDVTFGARIGGNRGGNGNGSGNGTTNGTTPSSNEVNYTVTFNATWSEATHPTNFPGNPHFSPLIGAVHNDSFSMWEIGATVGQDAAAGMEPMAEFGGTTSLRSFVETAITAGTAKSIISGSGIGRSPGSAVVRFTVSRDHPQVTLVSMIAPSPDWFVGVRNLDLFENNAWVQAKTINLRLYDAGTDDAEDYSPVADIDSNPKRPISRVTSENNETDFMDGEPHVGTFVFRRVE